MSQRGRRALAWLGPIHPGKVHRRDGNRCYMCGVTVEPVNPESRKRGTARSLDHVVPLSLGGEDTMFNLRVACMKCDNLKGNNADMVDIAALLPALVDDSWLEAPPALYRNVEPWTPPPKEEEVDAYTMRVIAPKPKKDVDGWWNYEDEPVRAPDSTISATQITSREQLHAWWNRNKPTTP